MTFGQRLHAERRRRHVTQDELAEVLNTTKQSIYKYERGIVENIPFDKLHKLADYLGVSPIYLMGWSDDPDAPVASAVPAAEEEPIDETPDEPIDDLPDKVRNEMKQMSTRRYPLLGEVACGQPIYAEEDHETYVRVTVGRPQKLDFCLTAKGDSMVNARIFDGDTLFVRAQPLVEDGEIAVVLIDDEATVKRVWYDRENGILTLIPENPAYKTMRYMGEDLNRIRILGKVIAVQYLVK